MRTVAFCEIDPYCRAVLRKHWPDVPIHEDVKQLDGKEFWPVDVVCGGFPCQPYSRAGKQRGADDDRDLWPQMVRVIAEAKPTWAICENTLGIFDVAIDEVLSALADKNYETSVFVLPACAINAWHRRDRVWIVAHTKWREWGHEQHDGASGRMGREFQPFPWNTDWQGALREFRGMDDGLSYGVDRVDTIRNAVVPQLAEIIGRAILETEKQWVRS